MVYVVVDDVGDVVVVDDVGDVVDGDVVVVVDDVVVVVVVCAGYKVLQQLDPSVLSSP